MYACNVSAQMLPARRACATKISAHWASGGFGRSSQRLKTHEKFFFQILPHRLAAKHTNTMRERERKRSKK